jgi:Ca-activated chloride channel family protein
MVAEVTLEQRYVNPFGRAICCEYAFPIPDNGVMRSFEVTVGDRHIVGSVEEKEEARGIYRRALAEGKSAFMAEQQAEMLDVFICRVGNLHGGEEALVRLTYIMDIEDGEEMTHDDATQYHLRVSLPSAVAPRYSPTCGGISVGGAIELPGLFKLRGKSVLHHHF